MVRNTAPSANTAPGARLLRWQSHFASIPGIPLVRIGGINIAALDRDETADLMVKLTQCERPQKRPWILTSANGEVLSRCASEGHIASLFAEADLISADSQPLVLASRLRHEKPLPQRVATTDLFHNVASRALKEGLTFYIFGATEEENARAVQRSRTQYPGLKIVGCSHGYLTGRELDRKVAEINELAPDVLWVALGVPREQEFCRHYAEKMPNVGMIKTSGGLLNFLSGTRRRAPWWMQQIGLEWLYRVYQEPHRLFWRYAVTNPHALYLILTR